VAADDFVRASRNGYDVIGVTAEDDDLTVIRPGQETITVRR
jgi:hypothetical protein